MNWQKWSGILFVVLAVLVPTSRIYAEGEGILNKLLAPGPLIEAHKEFEGADCLKCHATGKGIPNEKCLDCHKDIRKFVDEKRGYHGQLQDACIKCHTDHKGREFDAMAFDAKTFDHAKTGFSLQGKHEKLKCAECHTEKHKDNSAHPGEIRYLGKTNSCTSCHKKDDVHFYQGNWAKKDCNACHGARTWKDDIKFNHRRDTGYELVDAHEDVKCVDCHKVDKIKKTARYVWSGLKVQECLACHADFHKNEFSPKFKGGKCQTCHAQDEWKIEAFNHAVTGYKLRGKHMSLECAKCHTQSPQILKTGQIKNYLWHGLAKKTACVSCHQDYHLFNGHKSKTLGALSKCSTCHTESDWHETDRFDHNTQTRYPIDGRHIDLKCEKCHISGSPATPRNPPAKMADKKRIGQYFWPALQTKTCENCHKSPHLKVFSKTLLAKKCTVCHVTDGWKFDRAKKNFDHKTTRFALTGKHTSVACNDCHLVDKKQVFRFPSAEQKFCIDCHKNEHTNQFSAKFAGMACGTCHTTEKFDKLVGFDHNTTRFKLRDAHALLHCGDCHIQTADHFAKPSTHVKHQFVFPNLSSQGCVTCHADDHAGQLGTDCAKCHSEKTWKKPNFNHAMESQFALKGQHANLKCDECHRPIRNQFVKFAGQSHQVIRYKPLSSRCNDCHADYHAGQLSSDCSKCHVEKSWKESQFDHSKDSQFQLRGKHEALKCSECHKPVKDQRVTFKGASYPVIHYKPMAGDCTACHKDAHSGTLSQRCTDCHNETNWHKINNFHRDFTLTGVHNTLSCAECHRDHRRLSGTSQQCLVCHQKDDVHSGSLPNCGECHLQQFWEHTKFNHSMSFFSLRGVHRTLDCAECHAGGVYRGLPSQCINCHQGDAQQVTNPPHIMPNFSNCQSCHNQFAF